MASSSPPSSAPKAMSSRLLTMKFMQRAAASPTTSPSAHEEPPNKRRRRDIDLSNFNTHALTDQKTIQRAVAEEEAKQQAALDRQAAESGDTRWVLSFEDDERSPASPSLTLRVVQTGYANLDSLSPLQIRSMEEEEPHDKAIIVGRRSFGNFNRVLEKQQDPTIESDDDDDEENADEPSEDSDAESDDPTNELIKTSRKEALQRAQAESRAKKRGKTTKADELAKQRKKKEVNLNGLTSLSGSKPASFTKPLGPCYQCNGPHLKANCPENKRGHPGGDDGPPRKTFRSR